MTNFIIFNMMVHVELYTSFSSLHKNQANLKVIHENKKIKHISYSNTTQNNSFNGKSRSKAK